MVIETHLGGVELDKVSDLRRIQDWKMKTSDDDIEDDDGVFDDDTEDRDSV